jgi:hypothetical protein
LRYAFVLLMICVTAGWSAAEMELSRSDARAGEPEWRRTSQGWVKVGGAGPTALKSGPTKPAPEPSLHPGILAAFLLCSALLSLLAFEHRASRLAAAKDARGGVPATGSPVLYAPSSSHAAIQHVSHRASDLVNPHRQ